VPLAVNAIVNPGFETGTMSGWIPTTWSVATVNPHTGVYDAYDRGGSGGGGLCLRQNFAPPIDSDDVTAFTFWLRQIDDLGSPRSSSSTRTPVSRSGSRSRTRMTPGPSRTSHRCAARTTSSRVVTSAGSEAAHRRPTTRGLMTSCSRSPARLRSSPRPGAGSRRPGARAGVSGAAPARVLANRPERRVKPAPDPAGG